MAGSQSSILDFATDEESQYQGQSSAPSSAVGSPSLFRNAFSRSEVDNGMSGEASLYMEKKHDRAKRESTSGRSPGRKGHRSTITFASGHKSTPSNSTILQNSRAGRKSGTAPNTAAYSLSLLETEFQQQIHRQSLFFAQKIELRKELLSLYSRRRNKERKQEEAVKSEQFEEAESATAALRLVQERIQKLEGHYTETDCTDELGKSITEMHQAVMQELDQMKQTKEKEQENRRQELQRIHEGEIERIQSERDEIERERSDIALEEDFLGKNEAELLEQMDEETRAEQEELDNLKAKRNATRAEIQELTKKLEQLNNEDKEHGRGIEAIQQKIAAITRQFDGKAKEVSNGKEVLGSRSDAVQQKSRELDRQEVNVQKQMQDAEATQRGISEEIQGIITQRDRLEEVRRLFDAELMAVHKLRLEEESFRETESGWNMRASSLHEELKRYEVQIETLTTQSADDQRAITDLEAELEENNKRVGTIESLKALSVQRRDFKQASHLSGELTKCREMISQQKAELERLTTKMSGPIQEQLEELQKEYENARTLVKNGEAALLKEIQAGTTDTLARLETILAPPSTPSGDDDDKEVSSGDTAPQETSSSKATTRPTGQLSQLLLNEMRSEIEGVRDVSRARYGHEESLPTGTAAGSKANNSEEGSRDASVDTNEKRQQLEQDIQAAVLEENYDAAAELQARLDAL
ncbi:hypothetical protein BGX31_007981 [Mortierella sp. GBA43]|nr:hypothetical protein BGX31_007981 [Mortierella sp. GBA43]